MYSPINHFFNSCKTRPGLGFCKLAFLQSGGDIRYVNHQNNIEEFEIILS